MGQSSVKTKKCVKVLIITLFVVHIFLYVQVQEYVLRPIISIRKTPYAIDSFDQNCLHHIKLTKNQNVQIYQKEKVLLSLEYIKNISFPVLTIFTSWEQLKAKYVCRNNTLENWNLLHPFVKPILFTNDKKLQRQIRHLRWKYLPMQRMAKGVPVLKYMYKAAQKVSNTPLYAYANGDILFTKNLISTIMTVLSSEYHDQIILLIGRRTNIYNITRKEALDLKLLKKIAKTRGQLFLDNSQDFFITSKNYPWDEVPEVIIGRVAYDNYLVFDAIKNKRLVIDGTKTILAVHQSTASGNFEGHNNSYTNYNLQLLASLNETVDYSKGKTSCATFVTDISSEGYIVLKKRKPFC